MIIVSLIILGLCFGSFVNALVWRLHQQDSVKSKKTKNKYSITKGHSMCPNCQHRLQAKDLVPVLSWIELRGRCRYCQDKISWQYPLVEIVTASLFLVSYFYWPYSLVQLGFVAFGLWLVILILFMAMSVYDLRWMILPDRLVLLTTIASGLLVGALALDLGDLGMITSPILGGLLLGGAFWAMYQLSGGKWIGGGDVKLGFAIGLLAGGLLESILLLFTASLLGTLVSIPILVKGGRASHKVPFGPFLIASTVLVFLWGQDIINWYTAFIGV